MFFYLKISSKEKRILKIFLHFFTKLTSFPIFLKSFSKKEKRFFVTVLKSPHVNKTAQEQFEYRFYSRHYIIRSFKPLTFFLLLKKLKNFSFPGINLEIKGFFEKNKAYKHALQMISPDNIILQNVSNLNLSKSKFEMVPKIAFFEPMSSKSNLALSKKYIQLFDLYGELYLKKTFYL